MNKTEFIFQGETYSSDKFPNNFNDFLDLCYKIPGFVEPLNPQAFYVFKLNGMEFKNEIDFKSIKNQIKYHSKKFYIYINYSLPSINTL